MAKRIALPQSKLKQQRRRRRVRLIILLAAGIVVLIGAIIGCTWIPYIRVSAVEVTGTETQSLTDIQILAQETLRGRYLFVIPKNNVFLYPKEEVLRVLYARYPAIKQIDVKAKNFTTVAVVVVERHPTALWCGETPAVEAPCGLMDENGFVYGPAANFSGDAYVRYFGQATTTEGYAVSEMPKKFLTPQQFRTLVSLTDAFAANQKGIGVQHVSIDASDDATLAFANGFSVLFAMSDIDDDVFERFTLGLQSEPFQQHPIGDFDYLDLRFGDKLYYHLKTK